ncbi:MAG: CoA transferase [Pseudomonadota bacterium]
MSPLSNVRVVEFCQIAAGPFCGMLLADLGADVIKVEHPDGGDGMRNWPPFNEGFSENFASLNRNKRSVALDLKFPEGLAAARALALSADVVLENFRPGVMEKLGLGYPALAAGKPSLIYCSISAFGQDGPRARQGGFDLTIQAIAGVMSVTGEPDGPPAKCGVPISDFSAGLYAANGVQAALLAVRAGQPGCHVDVSMQGATLGVAALQTSEYFGNRRDPERLGSAHPRNAPYQAFQAADGFFAMAAGNDRLWQTVCRLLGDQALAEDPRFASTALRAANQDALKVLIEAHFAEKPAAHWLEVFAEAGVPSAPINGYGAALADPQVAHGGLVAPLDLPGGGASETVVLPLRFGGARPGVRRRPPALGEHTEEVLAELSTPHGG